MKLTFTTVSPQTYNISYTTSHVRPLVTPYEGFKWICVCVAVLQPVYISESSRASESHLAGPLQPSPTSAAPSDPISAQTQTQTDGFHVGGWKTSTGLSKHKGNQEHGMWHSSSGRHIRANEVMDHNDGSGLSMWRGQWRRSHFVRLNLTGALLGFRPWRWFGPCVHVIGHMGAKSGQQIVEWNVWTFEHAHFYESW